MIRAFSHKGLEQLFETGESRRVSADLQKRLLRLLDFINRAGSPPDVDIPGYRLHELKVDRKGVRSLSVSGNLRLTFKFQDGDAYDVDLEDYH